MSRLRISRAAERDLNDIAQYISKDGPHRAISFLAELHQQITALSRQPDIYPHRDELSRGLQLCPYKRYLILFRQTREGVRIVRVIHSARDLVGLL